MITSSMAIVTVLIIVSFFIIFKLYKDVKNKQKSINNWYHLLMLVISPVTVFVSLITINNVLFTVEDYFSVYSYTNTFISVVIASVFLFLTVLFYISAVDELLNNKLKHEKTSFYNKLNLFFSILFGNKKTKESN